MKNIKLKSARLQTLLSTIPKDCYEGKIRDMVFRSKVRQDRNIPDLHPCSDEYLYEAMKRPYKEYGFPIGLKGLGMRDVSPKEEEILAPIKTKAARIGSFLGTPNNALLMSYPDDGYIGWHHNGNAPGYNILLTHSQDGDGNFSFWDYDTKSIIRLYDVPGWQVRVGYYSRQDTEHHKLFWHMAETKKQRITLAWVMNHKEMWKNAIDEITGGDYDPTILDQ